MKDRFIFRFLLFCLLATVFAFTASAQEATIVGTVTDATGAVVPNVSITVTNLQTGQARSITTNEAGQYVVPDLRIGSYALKADAAGFKAAEQNDIVLNVGDRRRIDIEMQVGGTKESVTVEAAPVRVQADSGEISTVITGEQVDQLAMNGRNLVALAALTPGASSSVADFNGPTPVGSGFTISFNGARPDHNVWMVDGGEVYDRGSGGKAAIMPSMDAIAEFRTLTSNYGAEYGLGSGGTLSMVFKGGTKDFHGTAWEFFRNNAMDATPFFTNMAGGKNPELRYNVFGFNIGGPVLLPHYNKDRNKTFFFYNEEWRRMIQGGTFNVSTPSAAMRSGVFPSTIYLPYANQVSAAEAARFAVAGLTLPQPGQPKAAFPNNTIPAGLINPAATAFLGTGALNMPNSGTVVNPTFIGGNNSPTNVGEQIVRIDHQFNDKFWVFGHWVSEQVSQTYGTTLWSGDNFPSIGTVFGNPSYSGVLHATYAISPTVINETAFNYNGNRISITPGGIYKRTTDFNPPELFSGNADNRLPSIAFGGSGINSTWDAASWPWFNKADDYQLRNDLSWTHGKHNMKFGGQYMIYKKSQQLFGNTQGNFNFNGTYSGNGFADFLLGYASTYQELAIQDSGHWSDDTFALYFQDNWRATNRLTVNLGLRWEGMPHTYEDNHRMSNFYPGLYNPADAAVVDPATGIISASSPGLGTGKGVLSSTMLYLNGIGIAGVTPGAPNGIVNNHWNNWAPRVGFAYDLTGSGKTIFRGGTGIMYERVQGNDVYNMGPNVPFSQNPSVSNVFLSNPGISVLTGAAVTSPILPPSITGESLTGYKLPVVYQWSFGVQQEVFKNAVFSASYVGNAGRHQNEATDINSPLLSNAQRLQVIAGTLNIDAIRPYPGFNSILVYDNNGNSHYNAFQTEFRMQAVKGLTVQIAYTYSKAYDQGTGNSGSMGDLATISNPYNRAYDNGLSGLDRPNIFLVDYVYELPFFRTTANKVMKSALGGWVLSGITVAESGTPFTVTMSGNTMGMSNYTNRPDLTGAITYPGTRLQYFNTGIFAAPVLGQFGSERKNVLRGPSRQNWNMSLFKDFDMPWREGMKFELRFESFNTFNHTQWNNISTTYGSSNFGQITSAFDPRTLQLGAKFVF